MAITFVVNYISTVILCALEVGGAVRGVMALVDPARRFELKKRFDKFDFGINTFPKFFGRQSPPSVLERGPD